MLYCTYYCTTIQEEEEGVEWNNKIESIATRMSDKILLLPLVTTTVQVCYVH